MQGHSAAVKEAVGAGLMGCKAPFRLVQDHSRSGRLEASSLALRKWLFSDAFEAYFKLIHVRPLPSASHSSHLLNMLPHPPGGNSVRCHFAIVSSVGQSYWLLRISLDW